MCLSFSLLDDDQVLIPRYLSERNVALYGMLLSAVQTTAIAFCTHIWHMYILSLIFCLGALNYPAFKAIVVTESLQREKAASYQANLQGAISSIRTLATALGSLIFSSLFSIGMSMKPVALPGLPFVAAGGIYFVSFLMLTRVLVESKPVDLQGVTETLIQPQQQQQPQQQRPHPHGHQDPEHGQPSHQDMDQSQDREKAEESDLSRRSELVQRHIHSAQSGADMLQYVD